MATGSLESGDPTHHDTALFTWRLGAPDSSEPVAIGYDTMEFTDQHIRRVVGYF